MSSVFVTSYKVVGDGVAIAENYFAEYRRIQRLHLDLAESFGAEGYRALHGGGIHSLLFEAEKVDGFKKPIGIENHNGKRMHAMVPRLQNKEVVKALQNVERLPKITDLTKHFGWHDEYVYSGASRYRPTEYRFELPELIYLLRLPRQPNDGWTCPATLEPISEAECMEIFDAHNKLAREQKNAA